MSLEESWLDFCDTHIYIVKCHLGEKPGTCGSLDAKYLKCAREKQIIFKTLVLIKKNIEYDSDKIVGMSPHIKS
jgi:tryptophan 2,3-dioxygenase